MLYVSGKEFVDLVCDSRVFHDCYDSIVKPTTEPCQYSEMLHIYAVSHCLYALTLTSRHNHAEQTLRLTCCLILFAEQELAIDSSTVAIDSSSRH